MTTEQMLDEIRDLNLSYLILAQNLIRADRAEACYRLGISEETATQIGSLTSAQIARISSSNQLMCRVRFDDNVVWDLLASHARARPAAGMHAAILMASQYAEAA
jgi:flagellar transcriptional activator FlhD